MCRIRDKQEVQWQKKQQHGSESRELKQETVFNISVTVGFRGWQWVGMLVSRL